DVVMPGMNGFSVLRALRHDPATRDIPIIMISGNQQATEQFYLQRYGADDFMKKPFDRDDVYERIGSLVAAGRLPARDTSVAENTLLSALSAETLDGIPDIAMPDAGNDRGVAAAASRGLTARRLSPAISADTGLPALRAASAYPDRCVPARAGRPRVAPAQTIPVAAKLQRRALRWRAGACRVRVRPVCASHR